MFLESQKRLIAGDDVASARLKSRGDVLVVVRVLADAGELLRACNQVGEHDDVLEPQLGVGPVEQLANFGVGERSQDLIHDGRRDHDLEARITQEPLDQPARRAAWLDDGAEVDVRVEDSAQQGLLGPAASLAGTLPRRALRFERDLERLLLAQRALFLFLEELQRVPPRETPHLLQPLDRHQRGQWLALPLDDKLIVAKRDSVEEVTDPLPNVDRGYFFHL